MENERKTEDAARKRRLGKQRTAGNGFIDFSGARAPAPADLDGSLRHFTRKLSVCVFICMSCSRLSAASLARLLFYGLHKLTGNHRHRKWPAFSCRFASTFMEATAFASTTPPPVYSFLMEHR